MPDWLGDFQNPDFPEVFARYSAAFARRFPWVQLYTPVNEMFICAQFSAKYGWWNEEGTTDLTFVTALKHIVKANVRGMQEILDASPAADWRSPDPENTLYLELDAGRVVIELAPGFAPEHVANIRTLAREGFWDGTSIYRVQDNFVAQFGDADADDAARAKPLGTAKRKLPAEFERDAAGLAFEPLPDADGWAPQAGFADGFAAGRDPDAGKAWLAHCYGAVGAGRNLEADSSLGAELYVVIGQAPRQLDRTHATPRQRRHGAPAIVRGAEDECVGGQLRDSCELKPCSPLVLMEQTGYERSSTGGARPPTCLNGGRGHGSAVEGHR